MKTTTTLLAVILISVFSFSCKKKEKVNEPEPSPAPATTVVYDAFSEFSLGYKISDTGGPIATDSTAGVFFTSNLYTPSGTLPSTLPPTVSGGTVYFNNNTLGTSTIIPIYYYNWSTMPSTNITSTVTWSVTGSGTITPISYSYKPSYPNYTGFNLLPDTCIKANGISLNISGVSNFSGNIKVRLYTGGPGSVSKNIASPGGTLNFTQAEIAGMTINSTFSIILSFENRFTANIGGVVHGFNCYKYYEKYVWLK